MISNNDNNKTHCTWEVDSFLPHAGVGSISILHNWTRRPRSAIHTVFHAKRQSTLLSGMSRTTTCPNNPGRLEVMLKDERDLGAGSTVRHPRQPNQYLRVSYVSHEGGRCRCMLCKTGGMNPQSAKKHFQQPTSHEQTFQRRPPSVSVSSN
jgi:hypothetical protein